MKTYLVLIMFMLGVDVICAQTYQQTNIELDSEIPKDKSFVYEASTSIKMKRGFHCKPERNNTVKIAIDRFGVFPPDEGITGGMTLSNQDGVVGALPGELNVSDIGAAVYSIPIMIPKGIGMMTPEMELTYNSQAGNGILGWAWDLSGLSSIERVGQTLYHDGNLTSVNFVQDRYAIDGKRLMLCNGNYGGNGSVYKTEVDEMSKIVSYSEGYNGPARFLVHKKDGTVWEYGGTDDSRIEPQNKNNVVLKWLVNRISDPDGNYIAFNYIENQSTGESYINRIDYTLNDIAGINMMYRIDFVYDEKEDSEVGYVYENVVQNKRLLKDIIVRNLVTGTVLYDYSFEYLAPGNYSSDVKFMYHRLKSIGLTAGDIKLNPTVVSWNKKSHYPDKFISYSLDRNIFNKVPFVGDFNGDGYSDVILVPYKTGNSYPSNVEANVYINKGDGSFDENACCSLYFDKSLEWVYVVDFDGDGLDDVVPYYANYDANSSWKSKIQVLLNRGNSFLDIGDYSCSRFFTVYPGDFNGDRRVGFFLEHNNNGYSNTLYPYYIYYNDNSIVSQCLDHQAYTYIPERVWVEDVNGDGCDEILYLMDNSSIVAKLQWNYNRYEFFHLFADNDLDSGDFLFPGDFNGDGYTDFLIYDEQDYWNIVYSDGRRFKTPASCLNNNLLRGLTLAPQDRYQCSLKNLSMPSVTIRTADFDGDGKTDVAVFKNTGGNYYMEIGFKMYEKTNNNYDFHDIRRFYMNINYSHQYVHLGNFLGRENASVLSNVRSNPGNFEVPKIVSLNPHSSKFVVERITDGLGNTHGLRYDYMMPGNSCYNYDYQWIDADLRTVSIPIKALRSDTVYSVNSKPCVKEYSYNNALYHTKGHGLLGFQQIESKLLINNMLYETNIYESDFETMSDYYIVLPKTNKKYNNNQLVFKEEFYYNNYLCTQNNKVVMPLLTLKKTINYDCDAPCSVMKSNIQNIYYQSDMSGGSYSDVVNVVNIIDGADANFVGDDALSCAYRTETYYTYNNDVANWIVARLQSQRVSMYYDDNESVGNCDVFEYSGNNPYKMTKKTSLPNANMNYADPLKIVADFSYDVVGHVVMQSLMSPSSKSQRVRSINYSPEYNYRYPTKTINENGWEIDVSYDNDYGAITSTLDYNQFETESISDPFEITVENTSPDGVKNVKAKRWAKGNQYSPTDAAYYCWEKSSGNAENIVFYTKNGKKLREVTFGLNGEAIYVDMTYDDYGNMLSKSMPYKADANPKVVYYVYDKNNRLIEEVYPNGLVKNYTYNKLQTSINTISPEGVSHTVTESYNPMGWRTQTVDIGGNTINYEYYSDGKLKSAMIGDNALTKVEYEYDGRRNILRMNDPACGEILYCYNAFGELTEKTTAKNCVTTYSYDNMGNLLGRTESDENGHDVIATQWIYNNDKGKIGMLSRVVYGSSHTVSYDYDDLLRIQSVEETINGKNYLTSYTYDNANREEVVTYPSGLAIQKKYSNSGCFKSVVQPDNKIALYKADNADAMGYVIDCQYGNGVKTRMEYDENTNLLTGIHSKSDNAVYQNLIYSYDGFGNLINRTRLNGINLSESFVYDDFNRLVEIKLNNKITGHMEYDDYGNILSKNIDNEDIYYDAQYHASCPYAVSKVKTDLDEETFFRQNISFTVFDKMQTISCANNTLSIDYGCDYDRIHSVEIIAGKMKEKTYVSDCEYVNDNGKEFVYTYLKGPIGIFAVCRTDDKGISEYFYVLKDNLGSWCMITDEKGSLIQKTSYDAWGNPRNESTWTGKYSGDLLCDRGFTGHEHLPEFGIINMNGRAYDPLLSMMMSPDENIQNPDFSQNYNRYIYCYNNPLSYNDPSGEFVEWLMYGIFSGVVNVACNWSNIDSYAEGALSFGAGFVSGCLTKGLSECSWTAQVIGNVAGATIKSGVNSFVKQNTGSGLDWNFMKTKSFKEDVMYAVGSNIAKSVLNAYIVQPTDSDDGKTLCSILCKEKFNQKLFETASKKIVGNIFAGRKLFSGLGISKDNWEDALPYLECVGSMFVDNVEFTTSSETLSNISSKILNFDFSGVAKKYASDMNYCYSQFRALFVKKGG